MLFMLAFMLLLFWGMSRLSRSQQKRMRAEQERRTDEALVPGNWVRTRAGFYGTVVEVSGDVVTLATPLGDESLWAKSAIVDAEEPPFATDSDDSGDDSEEETVIETADAPDDQSVTGTSSQESHEAGEETDTGEKGVKMAEAVDAEEDSGTEASQA